MSASSDNAKDDPQSEIVAFLSAPGTLEPGAGEAERVETHISHVFLSPNRAVKLKRAVTFPYLDFSTAELRRRACEAEVEINRRTAPDIYKGIIAVTRRADGSLTLGGDGEVVDWVVDMVRFDEDTLFDRLATRGELRRRAMEDLADAIAAFHGKAEPRPLAGGGDGIAMIIDNNAKCFARPDGVIFDEAAVEIVNTGSRQAVRKIGEILEDRRERGRVRHCHGDLHLRNIFSSDHRPTLFDAIEFNVAFAEIDVLYDLAFLLMDLDHRGLRRLASITMNRYLDATGEAAGEPCALATLPLFLSMRAAIRAHVGAAQADALSDEAQRRRRADEAVAYLELAADYLAPPTPRLVAVGGLSGSGKSRLARELAPFIGAAPGARVVRTDATRKRLVGVALTERLPEEGYSADMTARTYAAFYDEIRNALGAGHAVIADAVFAKPEQRRAIADVAAECGVAFDGLWLEASPEVQERRVAGRRRNVSDATVEIVRQQRDYDLGRIDWARIDSSGEREATEAKGKAALGL